MTDQAVQAAAALNDTSMETESGHQNSVAMGSGLDVLAGEALPTELCCEGGERAAAASQHQPVASRQTARDRASVLRVGMSVGALMQCIKSQMKLHGW